MRFSSSAIGVIFTGQIVDPGLLAFSLTADNALQRYGAAPIDAWPLNIVCSVVAVGDGSAFVALQGACAGRQISA